MTFYPLEGAKTTEGYPVKVDPATGNFEITGADGKGIPPGKYRVAVSAGAFVGGPGGPSSKDPFEGKFGKDNSPIIREIDGKSEIIIDLDKPE